MGKSIDEIESLLASTVNCQLSATALHVQHCTSCQSGRRPTHYSNGICTKVRPSELGQCARVDGIVLRWRRLGESAWEKYAAKERKRPPLPLQCRAKFRHPSVMLAKASLFISLQLFRPKQLSCELSSLRVTLSSPANLICLGGRCSCLWALFIHKLAAGAVRLAKTQQAQTIGWSRTASH